MKKTQVLACGCGGCGNNLLDDFLGLDKRYTGIFMNTNLAEMETKNFFDRERKCFYIPNADGTGKDRSLCEKYVKEEAPKFMEMINKFPEQNHFFFYTSANGGTGSKASLLLSRVIKKAYPEKSISICATMPNIGESDIDFRNAEDFWNELLMAKKNDIIDNFYLVDNNKQLSIEEINQRAMSDINASFDDVIQGNLDSSDITRFHKSKGYNVILRLDREYRSATKSIENAMNESVFFMPSTNSNNKIECDVFIANINKNDFDEDEIRSKFSPFEFSKVNLTTEGETTILLGGCNIPKDGIELVQEALEEINRRKISRQKDNLQDLLISKENRTGKPAKNDKTTTRISSKDLDDLFADDDFWN